MTLEPISLLIGVGIGVGICLVTKIISYVFS